MLLRHGSGKVEQWRTEQDGVQGALEFRGRDCSSAPVRGPQELAEDLTSGKRAHERSVFCRRASMGEGCRQTSMLVSMCVLLFLMYMHVSSTREGRWHSMLFGSSQRHKRHLHNLWWPRIPRDRVNLGRARPEFS